MSVQQSKVAVIIPIYHPDDKFIELLGMLKRQSLRQISVLVIDSASDKKWQKHTDGLDIRIKDIDSRDFNHGGTRQMGVDMCHGKDIFIFMTQDAVLADEYAIENLVRGFDNEQVGCAYGRQLPHRDANVFASFARLHNYPAESYVRSFEDRKKYGMKTAFLSDSFAAYRKSALEQAGGFPANVVLSEDMYVAAKMLMQGWQVAYVAEAMVYHSHNYSVWQEFKRYRDIGRFHGQEKWIRETFGEAEGNGKRFVMEEARYVWEHNACLLMEMVVRDAAKFLGYSLAVHMDM